MADEARDYLIRQFETAWKLTTFHLDGLTTEECLWRPARIGLHVHQVANGTWRGDWPSHERYDGGPPSIAWLTWHLGFWWSMVLDHSFGDGALTRENVAWPGNAATYARISTGSSVSGRQYFSGSPQPICDRRSERDGRSGIDRLFESARCEALPNFTRA